MNLPYTTTLDRRALMADRDRATRPLADLIARERVDLTARPTLVRPPIAVSRPWTGVLRAIQSLSAPVLPRSRSRTVTCV